MEEYFSRHAGSCRDVYPAAPVLEPRPILLNATHPGHFSQLRDSLPGASVISLRRARLLGSAGWIVGRRDTFLVEASFWREAEFPQPFHTHSILSRKRARPVRRLKGRCLSLASDFAIGSFGHFLHDCLPRLHLVEMAGHRLPDFDWVYLPRIDTPATRALVTALDFPRERILQHDPNFDLEVEELVATTYPGTPGHLPSYTPIFLQKRFAQSARPPTRRVFLSREGFRRDLSNRHEIEQLLLARGFEICRPHLDDAVRACAEAAFIVSQEGANLMNALFAPRGTRVLLLLPEFGNTLPYAFTLAAAAGHDLLVQSCPLVDRTPGHEPFSPVRADLPLFAAGLDQLLHGR